MNVKVKKLYREAILPTYAKQGDAGLDLHSSHSFDLMPGERALVKTGIAIELPEGLEMQIRPRSGLAVKYGITVLNAPGTIDSGYRGEIGVILYNASKESFRVTEGDAIAQGVIASYVSVNLIEADELIDSERGVGGFGHTGRLAVQQVGRVERHEHAVNNPVQLDWIDESTLQKAWREGTIAGESGFRKTANPYSAGTDEAQHWEDARYMCDHSTTLKEGQ